MIKNDWKKLECFGPVRLSDRLMAMQKMNELAQELLSQALSQNDKALGNATEAGPGLTAASLEDAKKTLENITTFYYATQEHVTRGQVISCKETVTSPEFIVFHPSDKAEIESLVNEIGGRLVPVTQAPQKPSSLPRWESQLWDVVR